MATNTGLHSQLSRKRTTRMKSQEDEPKEKSRHVETARTSTSEIGESSSQYKKGYLMLSYSWKQKEVVEKISQRLEKDYRIWIDEKDMVGDIDKAMAKAVKEVDLVLVCLSKAYEESDNCRAEVRCLKQFKTDSIPLMMEKYEVDSWVASTFARELYVDFSNMEEFDERFEYLLTRINLKLQSLNITKSTQDAGTQQPTTNPDQASMLVDSEGGTLKFQPAHIELVIPPGAIPEGKQVNITLGAFLKEENVPVSNHHLESRIAPIVECGPSATVFSKPCSLSFPHNAVNEKFWEFTLLVRESSGDTSWKRQESDSRDTKFSVRNGRCYVEISHFSLFTLIAKILDMFSCKRIMKLGPFGKKITEGKYLLRVRLWNDYDTKKVNKEESKYNEKSLDVPISIEVAYRDMDITIDELSDSWHVQGDNTGTFKDKLIWSKSPPHHTFVLNMNKPSEIGLLEVTITTAQGVNNSYRSRVFKNITEIQETSIATAEPGTSTAPTGKSLDTVPAENPYWMKKLDLSDDKLQQLLGDVSEWWDKFGSISMLKVILNDFKKIPLGQIEEKTESYTLFELLLANGYISQTNVDVLIEAVALGGQNGVEPKIKKTIPTFPGFSSVVINKFSDHRQNLIEFGKVVDDKNKFRIGRFYGLSDSKLPDPWSLILQLEKKLILTKDNKDGFIERLNRNGMKAEAKALTTFQN